VGEMAMRLAPRLPLGICHSNSSGKMQAWLGYEVGEIGPTEIIRYIGYVYRNIHDHLMTFLGDR